jgi:pilus assembly protein CpaF
MVNGADDVYVERKGRIERVEGLFFEGEEQVLHLIERIVTPLGLRVDESSPYVDARLSDGSRVNAVIPPLSLCGPVMTVRKFGVRALAPHDLVASGTVTRELLDVLARCVRARMNLIVSGGTGSGKTTLLNVLSSFISPGERLITIEDAAELRLSQPHVISLEARPPNVEGLGEVTVRALVRNALRMRPDRILVGEVRGGEALDMLQAMNTGHEGSMSTAHANAPADLLSRLETMALMSDIELPVSHVREQIAAAVDVVVHMARLADGRRAITHVASVEGLRDGAVRLTDVFVRDRHGASSNEVPGAPGLAVRRRGLFPGAHESETPPSPLDSTSSLTGSGPVGGVSTMIDGVAPYGAARWPGSLRRLGSLAE